MKVTITETFKNGVYLKAATTVVDGKERILAASMFWGVLFADQLNKLQDGLHNVRTIEVEGNNFKLNGVMELARPVTALSNQEVAVA